MVPSKKSAAFVMIIGFGGPLWGCAQASTGGDAGKSDEGKDAQSPDPTDGQGTDGANPESQEREDQFKGSLGNTDVNAFYDMYGGPSAFGDNTRDVMERFLLAEEALYNGLVEESRDIVNGIWDDYPIASDAWTMGFSSPKDVNLDSPNVYGSVRMLHRILEYLETAPPNHIPERVLTHTMIEVDCLTGTMPRTADEIEQGTGETATRSFSTSLERHHYYRAHRLFGRYIEAITEGALGYEIKFIRQDDGKCAPAEVKKGWSGPLNWYEPLTVLSPEVEEETDLYTVLFPDFRPTHLLAELDYGFTTGGMGSHQGRPVFICTDAALTSQHAVHDTHLRAYNPHWLHHEYSHHLHSIYPEYKLEETAHSYFDRGTWPADFEGRWQWDYYDEAYLKRYRGSSPSLSERIDF